MTEVNEVTEEKGQDKGPPVIVDLGVRKYSEVLEIQQQLCQQRKEGKVPDTIILVEHTPVVTLGARLPLNRLLEDEDTIRARGIDIVPIRRGGGATAHNAGQLVIYPIVRLTGLGLGVSEYINWLEEIGIELLGEMGVEAGRNEGFPGLWVMPRKIASIGVGVSRGVTYHGMAINICNDLSIFNTMVPCGLDGVQMTSVFAESGKRWEMDEVRQKAREIITRRFLEIGKK